MNYLYERNDFRELVEAAARQSGIANPAIVEKDYYVTEALRRIAERFREVVIFKGGTSLSKGWGIINRFSEDIDLYVQPAPSNHETLDRFSEVAEAVLSFPGFIGRSGRKDNGKRSWIEEFRFESKTEVSPGIASNVLLEAGIQSADQPEETVALRSILAVVLDSNSVPVETEDRASFPMRLLHFRRTFVEKLFTLHTRVERSVRKSTPLGRDARHFYDLSMLLQQPEVQEMLGSPEYAEICLQYRSLTEQFFRSQVQFLPAGMNLETSDALFPGSELERQLESEYLREVGNLCYGEFPTFKQILQQFQLIRQHLRIDV